MMTKSIKFFSRCLIACAVSAGVMACSDDDDYTASSTALLSDGAVVTGSSDVTATTATFHGTVSGLEKMNTASYATGFKYGDSQSALTETATAASAADFSATLTGLQTNRTIYYQAYVTLQGKVTYTGEVKSLVTTDATATTGEATNVDFAGATLAGAAKKYPAEATAGIVLSTSANQETVRAGLRLPADGMADSYAVTQAGLLPATTYYYAAYLDLGSGVVYGDVKSFTTDANEVDVDVDFIDLGLSVKWAKRNIGARTPGDFGGHFAFGDLTGTNPSIDPADYANASTYVTALDLAYQVTGGKGTLPTAEQYEELFQLCTVEWTTLDNNPGYKMTGPNGNSIFLPAAGKRVGSDFSETGTKGYYLTGSVNPANAQFAIDYEFTEANSSRATRATYEALAVRAVSTARNVKLDKSMLCHTWYLDIDEDAKTRKFLGPLYFYGSDDSWGSVTNGETVIGDSWNWSPDYAGNSWLCEAKDYGYMTFTDDGKVVVCQGTTVTEGTYTVDEQNKTITLTGAEILYLDNYHSASTNWSNQLRILSLDDTGLQIGVMRDNDPSQGLCQWSFNYVNEEARKPTKYQPTFLFWDDNYNQSWASFVSPEIKIEAGGQYTFEVTGQRDGGKVVVIDFPGLAATYPNAVIRVDKIEADGNEVTFDVAKLHCGDLENNGNYRIELFNIWGTGTGSDSPFGGGAKEQEPALAFNSSMKITYTIVTLEGFQAGLSAVASDWGGDWGSEKVGVGGTGTYTVTNTHPASNGMVVVLDIEGYTAAFPNASITLNKIVIDGTPLTFDESKIKYGDIEGKGNYRIELFNIWGSGTQNDSPFGGGAKESEPALGFTESMAVTFTVNSLY